MLGPRRQLITGTLTYEEVIGFQGYGIPSAIREDASWNVSLVRIVVPLAMDPPK
jgi:hypothetical protein